MLVNLKDQVINPAVPLKALNVFTGSALPVRIVGIGEYLNGKTVRGITVKLTNANGVEITGTCERSDGGWGVLFAATNFANYGFVSKGVRVFVTVSDGSATSSVLIGVGDFEILSASASAQPGTPSAAYQRRGDDEYLKSQVIGGVQHYVKQVMSYDPAIGWGADWTGDYILNAEGNFVPAT